MKTMAKMVALSSTTLVLCSASVLAGDLKLYKTLRDNNVITQAQYEELLQHNDTEVSVTTKGKLKFKSKSGDFQYQVGGRIMADAAYYNEDNTNLDSGTEFRRARLFVKGRMFEKWVWKAQLDYAGNGTEIKDMYLGYDFDPILLRIGQFGEAGGLEDTNSSKYITFMERSLPSLAFEPAARRMGIALNSYGDNWSYQVGLYGEGESDDGDGDEAGGTSARVTYAPWLTDNGAFHLGASFQYRETDGDTQRFRARPEAHVDNHRLVDTGHIAADDYNLYGLEMAWVNGPFSAQGEYLQVDLDRSGSASDVTFDGYSIAGSWFITGESRPYEADYGVFGRIKPKSNVGTGGIGAWELAIRFSNLDLNDDDIYGGEEDNITLGVNWYVNPNIRFMFNYVNVDTDDHAGDEDPDIFQVRAQIDF